MPCRCARSRTSVIALASADGRSNVDGSSSMRPASTFDRSRMSLISVEQVPAGGVDVLEVVVLLLVELAEQPLEQHLGEADDRVQRRAQLVRHVGQELGLVLVRDLELAALVLDLAEQPRVLDRDHRLVGEGLAAARCPCRRTGRHGRGRRRSRRCPCPPRASGATIDRLRCRRPVALRRAAGTSRVAIDVRDSAARCRAGSAGAVAGRTSSGAGDRSCSNSSRPGRGRRRRRIIPSSPTRLIAISLAGEQPLAARRGSCRTPAWCRRSSC